MAHVFYAAASELAVLTNTFTVDGTPTDPTDVTLTVTDPHGAVDTYTFSALQIARLSAGAYQKYVVSNLAGEWQAVWTGTGTAVDTQVATWTVHELALGRLYATPQQIKSRVGIPASSSTDDLELHAACFAASRSIETVCDRVFWRTTPDEVRTFEACSDRLLELGDFNDLVSVATLKTDADVDGTFETTWTAGTHYELLPRNPQAAPETRPYREIRALGDLTFPRSASALGRRDLVQITGVFGWPAVPAAVRMAAAIAAAELFKLKDAPFGVAGFGEFGAVRVRQNPMVASLVSPYLLHPVVMA